MTKTCDKQCSLCQNYDKENEKCKIKSKEEFNRINFAKEKCGEYLINDKLIMF